MNFFSEAKISFLKYESEYLQSCGKAFAETYESEYFKVIKTVCKNWNKKPDKIEGIFNKSNIDEKENILIESIIIKEICLRFLNNITAINGTDYKSLLCKIARHLFIEIEISTHKLENWLSNYRRSHFLQFADQKDIIQKSAIAFCEYETLENPFSFRAKLFVITKNRISDFFRHNKTKKRDKSKESELVGNEKTEEMVIPEPFLLDEIRCCLEDDEITISIIIERYYLGISFKEMADGRGIAASAMRKQHERILKKLKDCFEE